MRRPFVLSTAIVLALGITLSSTASAACEVINLHPAGAYLSEAYGVSGGQQVGWVNHRASLWSGTAGSWVDLHAFLPPNYSSSNARGIDVSGNDIWVAGSAHNSSLDRDEAMLWHNVIPEPSSLLALALGLPSLAFALRRRSR